MVSQMLNPSNYGISARSGFLSPDAPLTAFPNSYFGPWDELIASLPTLIKSSTLSLKIANLPTLSAALLPTDLELRRAYVVLAFLIHGYVWQSAPPNELVPPQLAQPFLDVCDRLGLHPVVSYIGLCTWNWKRLDGGSDDDEGMELDQLEPLASFTGEKGEAAFYHVPVMVEYEGGHLIHLLLDALRSIYFLSSEATETNKLVIAALKESRSAFGRMATQMGKLYSRLDANFFYHVHRPFMAGGKGMEAKGLPRGMVMVRDDGHEVECKFVGGSAVQSSLFPFLDAILGVTHRDGALFKEMRSYMPRAHRDFLAEVEKLPTLRLYIEENASNMDLREAYDACLEALRSWRGKHIAVVSKYIVQPAREEAKVAQIKKLEVQNVKDDEDEWELQGTGGSALIPFLKQAKSDTFRTAT